MISHLLKVGHVDKAKHVLLTGMGLSAQPADKLQASFTKLLRRASGLKKENNDKENRVEKSDKENRPWSSTRDTLATPLQQAGPPRQALASKPVVPSLASSTFI